MVHLGGFLSTQNLELQEAYNHLNQDYAMLSKISQHVWNHYQPLICWLLLLPSKI